MKAKERDYRDYLNDIFESTREIESFIEGITFEKFLKDKKTINAVVRGIEIIGEAAKHIPKSVKDKAPSIPWKKISGMRNKVIHEYFGVDFETVWKTAKNQIPNLKTQISELIKKEKS